MVLKRNTYLTNNVLFDFCIIRIIVLPLTSSLIKLVRLACNFLVTFLAQFKLSHTLVYLSYACSD